MNTAPGLPMPSEEQPAYRFDAGALCLEFLVTGGVDHWERLHSPADLAAWIPLARLGITGEVTVDEAELALARRVRTAVRHLAEEAARRNDGPAPADATASPGRAGGDGPGVLGGPGPARPPADPAPGGGNGFDGGTGGTHREDLDVLNEAAAAPGPVPRLGPALTREWVYPVTGAQFLSAVARDTVELFSGPLSERVRMCRGERCFLIFLDTSRPGTRRWCSMDRCGNRSKLRNRRRDRLPVP
ncbi:hypothetical protein FHS43_001642 [Streptosporangium becharense]|uniref:Zinc finger CGNR domain-containing protein n=1 Tax=Streptosporangium becharense TaxID=1816182 RepID=A0A7W9MJD0_9ACTN|nr:ABATE domain-containing protein [Streptosporangium becharense]MBB2910379.1 hypothetical protein [Streptosporangium becharense]MBB5823122.1 hypothetical protein [Streptosporangium becharense]